MGTRADEGAAGDAAEYQPYVVTQPLLGELVEELREEGWAVRSISLAPVVGTTFPWFDGLRVVFERRLSGGADRADGT